MKKLLIMLMVVAMAAFLFVGCLGEGVTPPVDDEEDEDVTPPTTVAPIITSITDNATVPAVVISLTATATQYMNKAEVALGIIVNGTAPTYSEVKIYIDDVCAGTGNTGDDGVFSIVVAKADLGSDGDKVLYATAKEAALAVSPKSTEYAFKLDTVAPGIDSVAASADVLDSAVRATTALSGAHPIFDSFTVGAGTAVAGTWTIRCLGDSSEILNVVVTDPNGDAITYTIGVANILWSGVIPGFYLDFVDSFAAGDASKVTVTKAAVDRYTLKFDEDVSTTGAIAGAYDILINATALAPGDPTRYKESNDTGYWSGKAVDLAVGDTVTFTVYGISDLAGNPGGTSAVPLTKTCNAGVGSATALAP